MGDIRTQVQQTASELKAELQNLDIADDVRQNLGVRIDQRLDELGARIGGDQSGQAPPTDVPQTPPAP